MELICVRHTSVDVPSGICYGRTDVPLSASFATEARRVAECLAGRTFDTVCTSPSRRCVRLADYCGFPDAVRDDRLMELDFGSWEMKRWDSLSGRDVQAWYDDWLQVPAGGAESLSDQYRRVASFVRELLEQGVSSALLFTHGGVISCLRVCAGECALDEVFERPIAYGEVLSLKVGESVR